MFAGLSWTIKHGRLPRGQICVSLVASVSFGNTHVASSLLKQKISIAGATTGGFLCAADGSCGDLVQEAANFFD